MGSDSPNSFFITGGTLPPNSACYLERDADNQLYELVKQGEFSFVLTTRQMGKSSLMARTARRLQQDGVRTVVIDLTAIGGDEAKVRGLREKWYYGLVESISDDLNLSTDVAAWWDEHSRLPLVMRLTRFLQDVVLTVIEDPVPIVIFVDEIDQTISLPFTDGFFAAIRSCHNARATEPKYQRLTFVLLGVASPQDLIADKSNTPFNIGSAIELADFTFDQAKPLLDGFATTDQAAEEALRKVLDWTGGHPYLTQQLCALVGPRLDSDDPRATVDRIVTEAFLHADATRSERNLSFVAARLLRADRPTAKILGAYRAVLAGADVKDDPRSVVHTELKLAGVLVGDKGRLRVRNRIYQEVFDEAWVSSHWPVDYARRVARVAVLLLLLSPLAWWQGIYPRQYMTRLRQLGDDHALAKQDFQNLGAFPLYHWLADDLWGTFNEHRLARAAEIDAESGRQAEAWGWAQQAHGEMGKLSTFAPHADRLLAEFLIARMAAMKSADQEVPGSILVQEQAYQLTHQAHAELKKLPNFAQRADPLMAEFYDSRVSRHELEEQRDQAIVWRIKALQYEDTAEGRRALAHLVAGDYKHLRSTFRNAYVLPLHSADLRGADQATTLVGLGLDDVPENNEAKFSTRFMLLNANASRLLSTNDAGDVLLWNTVSGEWMAVVADREVVATAAAFTADGSKLAVGSLRRGLEFWDAEQGRRLWTANHSASHEITALAIDPQGKGILTGNKTGHLAAWEVSDGKFMALARPLQGNQVDHISLNSTGTFALVLTSRGLSRDYLLWQLQEQKVISVSKNRFVMEFSPDGQRFLVQGVENEIEVWSAKSGQRTGVSIVPESPALHFAFTANDEVVTTDFEGGVNLWNAGNGSLNVTLARQELNAFVPPFFRFFEMRDSIFNDDRRQLMQLVFGHGQTRETGAGLVEVVNPQARLQVFDLVDRTVMETGVLLGTIGDISDDGKAMVGNSGGIQTVLRLPSAAEEWGTHLDLGRGHRAVMASDGRQVVVAAGTSLRIFDAEMKPGVSEWIECRADITQIATSPTATKLVVVSRDGAAQIWDAARKARIGKVIKHEQEWVVNAIFDPHGTRVLTVAVDGTARVWDAETGDSIGSALQHTQTIVNGRFVADGKRVATWTSADKDGISHLQVWDLSTGLVVGTQRLPATPIDIDSTNQRMLVHFVDRGFNRRAPRLMTTDGQSNQELSGAIDAVFSSDGGRIAILETLASGGEVAGGETTGAAPNVMVARMRDAITEKELGRWNVDAETYAIEFTPGGDLVSLGPDRLSVWEPTSGRRLGTVPIAAGYQARLQVSPSRDIPRILVTTEQWLHKFELVGGSRLVKVASRRQVAPLHPHGKPFVFLDEDCHRLLRVERNPIEKFFRTRTVEFEPLDRTEPVAGNPDDLLADWTRRLALRITDTGEIVPSNTPPAAP